MAGRVCGTVVRRSSQLADEIRVSSPVGNGEKNKSDSPAIAIAPAWTEGHSLIESTSLLQRADAAVYKATHEGCKRGGPYLSPRRNFAGR